MRIGESEVLPFSSSMSSRPYFSEEGNGFRTQGLYKGRNSDLEP